MTKTNLNWVKLILVMTMVALALSTPASEQEVKLMSTTPTDSVLMIGDSTTKRVTPWLAEHQPTWHVDGEGGRPIRALPRRIEVYLANNPAPDHFIMALGTNRSFDPDWSKQRLVNSLNKFPTSTQVYLMLVVRAGEFQEWKDVTLRQYNSYSRQIAQLRSNTFVIRWRNEVLNDPTLNQKTGVSKLLEDGTHQTGLPYGPEGIGVETYVRLIEEKLPASALTKNTP